MSAIGDWFRAFGHRLVTGAADVDSHTLKTLDVWEQIEADTLNLSKVLHDFEEFKFDPKWTSRVILVPKAIDAIQETFDIIRFGIRDKWDVLYQSVLTLKAALFGTVHHLPTNPDGSGIMTKIVDEIGALNVAWHAFGKAYHEATQFVEMLDEIKKKIETLDDLFLPQGRPKKTVDIHYRKRQR
jgi:hypothetical protein